ncbi:MAG: prephenate dehydrogenase [Oscillospiraceae bacterium]|nr:prephenate dehydrogenase [Oscillospiraceae bacterium]
MKIAIVGLGLIGGSLAKAIKKNTNHTCFAIDKNKQTILAATEQESIDGEIEVSDLKKCDVVIVCLYPEATVKFITENAGNFKTGGIVIDVCGVKGAIVTPCEKALSEVGVKFLGCHPMAGREFSGFEYAVDNLFDKASFIITKTENSDSEVVAKISDLALEIGFREAVVSTPEEHDKVIAFTSQLAHIVSSAYVKSPSLFNQAGFSAGSFKDLTRVAKLNEDMWTSLFMLNKKALSDEISCIIDRLCEYKNALDDENYEEMHSLLKDGRELKEKSIEQA